MKTEQNLDQYKYICKEVSSFVATSCSCNLTDFPSHYPLSKLKLYIFQWRATQSSFCYSKWDDNGKKDDQQNTGTLKYGL